MEEQRRIMIAAGKQAREKAMYSEEIDRQMMMLLEAEKELKRERLDK